MTRRSRTGLTLVELLVVIAVIAILASLLFPAIMQARGAGRKAQCESNLKQLAQAVQSFHHRNDCLPVYWGQMGASSNKVGGWLFHMLPDLDQQTAFDSVPGTPTGMTSGIVATTEVVSTGKMLPAIPASADYSPGVWKEIVTGSTTAVVNGSQQTIVETEWVLEGRKGTPGLPERPETITRTVFTPVNNPLLLFDIRSEYYALGRQLTLPLLNDPEDIGAFRSPSLATTGTLDASNQQLTNYQANAHVFLQFQPRVTWEVVRNPGAAVSGQWIILKNGMRALSPGFTSKEAATAVLLSGVGFDDTGRANSGFGPSGTAAFADAGRFLPGQGNNLWRHWDASRAGPPGRTLHHVTDGLSNTILFAEGRRQCDNLSQFRAAFFPTNNPMHEHGFGIECQWRRDDGTLALDSKKEGLRTGGNTLMFQTMPSIAQTNPLRAQALHGNYLMVAMCDGSTRAISSLVSRREPIGVNASGRENFGTVFYTAQSRGADPAGPRPDGVWDMLMVPSDPAWTNVLSNAGEIGREQ